MIEYVLVEMGADRAGVPLAQACAPFPLPPVARVPWAPAWVRGAIHHEGTILMVVDLARFAGVGDAGPRAQVFVPQGSTQLAFAVRAATVVRGAAEALGAEPSTADWLAPEARVGGVAYHPLDLEALLTRVSEAL